MQPSSYRGVSGVSVGRVGRWWVGGAQPSLALGLWWEKVLLTGIIPWIANLTAKGKQVVSSLCAGQVAAAGMHTGCGV